MADEAVQEPVPNFRPGLRSSVPLPPKFNIKGNLAANWKKWKQVWDSFEVITGLQEQDNKYRIATFITCIGTDALDIYNGLPFVNEEDKSNMDIVLELMENHCLGKTNVIYERYVFNQRDQLESESIESYSAQLRTLSLTCEFRDLQSELIRYRIVCGIRENTTRKKLLQEPDLTLARCIDICRSAETTTAQIKSMNKEEVHSLKAKASGKDYSQWKRKTVLKFDCKYCGYKHEPKREKCPAYGKECSKCGGQSHFAARCKAKSKTQKHTGKSKHAVHWSHTTPSDSDSSCEDILTIETINSVDSTPNKIFATLEVGSNLKKFQIDSGATCNVISRSELPPNASLQPSSVKLSMYNKASMAVAGKTKLKLRNPCNSKKYRVEFVVVEQNTVSLLGARAAQQMQLVKVLHENIMVLTQSGNEELNSDYQLDSNVNKSSIQTILTKEEILSSFPDVFDGEVGLLEGEQHLDVDPTVPPVKQNIRRVPVALKGQLKKELTRLEKLNIITPVNTPTDWISSLVIAKKPSGKLRVCLDPKPLNKALKRSNYPLPIIDDLLPELSKAKVFTKCDVKNGFWHVALDEESSMLTTFGTVHGRYRWLRLPFGVSPAPELFQRRLDEALANLPGTFLVADDILTICEGETFEDAVANHDERFLKLLQRCREKDIKLNIDKLELRKQQVPFIGHLLTSTGLEVDPKKVDAILKMPKPTDVQGVQRLVGLANYLSKFLKGLTDICEPLRQITKKDAEFIWTFEHDKAFQQIQSAVTQAPVLKYFDSTKEVTLQCDASETGLGATLLQDGQPVAYASRALTNTERNYAQIEKEALAIVYACNKFHQYTYGRKSIAESDHKPLETIQKKALLAAPKRLQRMLLALQKYDFIIVYKPGVNMYLADTLSRAYLSTTDPDHAPENEEISAVEIEVRNLKMADYLPVTESRLMEIQAATEQDKTLQEVKTLILKGWPHRKEEVPTAALPYFHIRDELTAQNWIIFRGNRCVIPSSLRSDILQRLHVPHTGIEACRRRARDCVYWPSMNAHIQDYISMCEACCTFQSKQQKETLQPHDIPDRPWAKIGTDIFSIGERDYLVTVDYFSDFFEVDRLPHKTGNEIIGKLKAHLSRHGIPDTLMSDNGPPFNSEDFVQFSAQYGFNHLTSSPGFPQSNGKVESAVKIAKRAIKKAQHSDSDPYLALLEIRNTPTEGCTNSPAQRLFSRRTKSLLPMTTSLLQPEVQTSVSNEKRKKRDKQTRHYNKHAKDLRPLRAGETVRIQPTSPYVHAWKKGVVENKVNIRSYRVRTDTGQTLRRNRKHLHNTSEKAPSITEAPTAPTLQPPNQTGATQPPTSPGNAPQSKPTPRDIGRPDRKPAEPITTRSGRISKPPNYLEAFVRQ